MTSIGSIVLRVDDLQRQVEFWAQRWTTFPGRGTTTTSCSCGQGRRRSQPLARSHRSTLKIPPRIHLDLYTDDQAGEVSRLLALGATEVHWDKRPPDADYVILADPEGNRFCVVDTTR